MVVRCICHTMDFLGVLGLADEPRTSARKTLVALRAADMERIIMLTRDNAGVGNAAKTAVGVDEVRARSASQWVAPARLPRWKPLMSL